MKKTVTYAITVCNEFVEIQRLIPFLLKNKSIDDEIVVLFDNTNGTSIVEEYLRTHSVNNEFAWYPYEFNGDFADYKNRLFDFCSTEYIFQIDADELPHENLIKNLPNLLENNVDLFYVPRVNTVEGLTEEHLTRWRWKKNKNGWINFPDHQGRIYKNSKWTGWFGEVRLKWQGKVHERIVSHSCHAHLPAEEEWSLYHPKTIDRQEKQNELYSSI